MSPPPLLKYPRTAHLAGSRLQPGDAADPAARAWSALEGAHVVIEEKLDGANAAFSFDAEGRLWLQSRGHYLTGGGRERHFDLFKAWARTHAAAFWARLGPRYLVFGEWLFAKHTIFYDALPHYFLEFDVFDRAESRFLSTPARAALLRGLPIRSAPVLHAGPCPGGAAAALVGRALYKSAGWRRALEAAAQAEGLDAERAARQTDPSDLAEGLYVKREDQGSVLERLKWVRADFLQCVEASDSHWLSRPILPNRLADGVDLSAARLDER